MRGRKAGGAEVGGMEVRVLMVHVLVAATRTWGRLATSAPAVEGTPTLPRHRPVPRLPEKPRRGTGRSRHGQGNHGAVRASPRFTHLHQLHPISSLIRVTSPPQHQASHHHHLPPLSAECGNHQSGRRGPRSEFIGPSWSGHHDPG